MRLPPLIVSMVLIAPIVLAPSPRFYDLGYGTWIAAPSWDLAFSFTFVAWWAGVALATASRLALRERRQLHIIGTLAACALASVIILSFVITQSPGQPDLTALARAAVWSWIAGVLAALWFAAQGVVRLTTIKPSVGETMAVALFLFLAPLGVWLLQKRFTEVLAKPVLR